MAGFLAYILPVDPGAHPDHGLPGQPPGTWGGAGEPFPGYGLPGGKPPGTWGGANEPMPTPPIYIQIPPDAVEPGVPSHPIYLPVYPAHPIVIPPESLAPGVPTHPIYIPAPPTIWPSPGRPAHPIVIPPGSINPGPPPVPAHPIELPPQIWGPTDPRPGYGLPGGEGPSHQPIPPKPTQPPTDGADKPPPATGGWGWVADWSKWGYFPAEGSAQPK